MKDAIEYYKRAEYVTDISKYKDIIEQITDNPEYICQIVQGLITHGAWCKFYGFEDSLERSFDKVSMSDLLDKILSLDAQSLTIPRLSEKRVLASCREFATLACAILRSKGIPARSRCGFSVYLGWEGSLEDHWIVEYWDGGKWIMNDPQIDPLQLSMLQKWGFNKLEIQSEKPNPNPHNLTQNDFIIAGKVWQLCRTGAIPAEICGIEDVHGLWFVRGQLLRDFASLNKIETVPYLNRVERGLDWSLWKLISKADDVLSENELQMLDYIAELTCDVDKNINLINEYYFLNSCLNVPQSYIMS